MTGSVSPKTLSDFVANNPGFSLVYRSYDPDVETIAKVRTLLPAARVAVVAEYWCGDSRRLTPRLARIAEYLPGWTFEVHSWDSTSRAQPLKARAIPTFVVYEAGKEVGRIVESPEHGTVEDDLLDIAERER
jgi:thioredoxin 1